MTGALIGGYFAFTFGATVGLVTFGLVFIGSIILSNLFGAMLSGGGSEKKRGPGRDET